jgi:hypothetical protein
MKKCVLHKPESIVHRRINPVVHSKLFNFVARGHNTSQKKLLLLRVDWKCKFNHTLLYRCQTNVSKSSDHILGSG